MTGITMSYTGTDIKDCRKADDVKDILQDLFSYIWNNRASVNFTTSLAAYLYSAVRNRVLDNYKHQRIKSDYIVSIQHFYR